MRVRVPSTPPSFVVLNSTSRRLSVLMKAAAARHPGSSPGHSTCESKTSSVGEMVDAAGKMDVNYSFVFKLLPGGGIGRRTTLRSLARKGVGVRVPSRQPKV